MRKKKIIIASSGRAHLLDCARELFNNGYDVTFYCITHFDTFKRFNLPPNIGHNMLIPMFPFVILMRMFPNNITKRIYRITFDLLTILLMHRCDVFICQSPFFSLSMRYAKKRYGAKLILDRGTSHIDTYNALSKEYGAKGNTVIASNHDRRQYQIADYIAIPSLFVRRSFIEHQYPEEKLFVNPYGVSLKYFKPTKLERESFDCICVGQWSKRKGCELIERVCKKLNLTLIHVGTVTDCSFPKSEKFAHINSVPENELIKYYSKAKIFLFPSFEDGFGLVLLQALVCGLPIVASQNSGAPDIQKKLKEKKWIQLMDSVNEHELEKCIINAISLANSQDKNHERTYTKDITNEFTWETYGIKYHEFLNTILK